nr:MAG TPA: hypothetical protein [Caudoviricetes sp.]
MVRFTSEDLRRLADAIDNREKYGNMCGVVYLRMKKHPNGKEFAEFEQSCAYAECYSNFYRFEEVAQ